MYLRGYMGLQVIMRYIYACCVMFAAWLCANLFVKIYNICHAALLVYMWHLAHINKSCITHAVLLFATRLCENRIVSSLIFPWFNHFLMHGFFFLSFFSCLEEVELFKEQGLNTLWMYSQSLFEVHGAVMHRESHMTVQTGVECVYVCVRACMCVGVCVCVCVHPGLFFYLSEICFGSDLCRPDKTKTQNGRLSFSEQTQRSQDELLSRVR